MATDSIDLRLAKASQDHPRAPSFAGGALVWSMVLSIVLTTACASDDGSDAAGTSAARMYAAAYCERLDRCRTRVSRDTFGDVSACERRFLPDIDDEFRSPGANISDAMAAACAAQLRAAPCGILISAMLDCQFAGALETGARCGSGYQCKSGSCARATDETGTSVLCGTCSERVGEGSDCTNANCVAGSVCAEGRCKLLSDLGTTCDAQPCKPDLQCFRGRCERPLGPNAECTPDAGDGSERLECDQAQLLFCAATSTEPRQGRCVPMRYAALGATCGFDARDNTLVGCFGASCSTTLTGTSLGTCVAAPKEGEPCGASGAPCEAPLYCLEGRCRRLSIQSCR